MFLRIIYIIIFIGKSQATQTIHEGISLATTELEPLVKTYKNIKEYLEEYVLMEEKRLSDIKCYLNGYSREHEIAMKDAYTYMKNPLNAFSMIKKLTIDLDELNKSLHIGIDNKTNLTGFLYSQDDKLPMLVDLEEAAIGIKRMRETYQLDVKDLADGNINGVGYRTLMSADDCFVLSKIYYDFDYFSDAEAWILEGIQKLKLQGHDDSINTEKYTWLTLLDEIQNELRYEELKNMDETFINEDATDEDETDIGDEYEYTLDEYKSLLCRDELRTPHNITKRLKCFLMANQPFSRLSPIKTEQLYIDPDIYLFHDVINDEDIEKLKKFAKPQKHEVTHPETRVATVLFYFSDVEQGGATVFLELGLTVTPIKKSALFWLNLLPSGEGDTATLHAACPVLVGSKWITTRWLNQDAQMFIRPCSLEYQQEETYRGEYPDSIPKNK